MMLSIITPTLNPGPCLEGLIESVVDQSFKDWEHVIIDGGSTDGTYDLMLRYPHLKRVSLPSQGIYAAMNTGISVSNGEWLYFIGADDKLHDSEVLADVSQYLGGDADVVYGDVVSPRFGGRYDGAFDIEKIRTKNICHQALFFRRSVFDAVGKFDCQYKAEADWDHNMRWMLNPNIASRYVDIVIADYSDGGFSSSTVDEFFQKRRIYNYLDYGRAVLPRNIRLKTLRKEMRDGWRCSDFPRISVAFLTLLRELARKDVKGSEADRAEKP